MGTVVPGEQGSVGMGCPLAPRRQDKVGKACAISLLGSPRQHKRSRMEQAISALETVSHASYGVDD